MATMNIQLYLFLIFLFPISSSAQIFMIETIEKKTESGAILSFPRLMDGTCQSEKINKYLQALELDLILTKEESDPFKNINAEKMDHLDFEILVNDESLFSILFKKERCHSACQYDYSSYSFDANTGNALGWADLFNPYKLKELDQLVKEKMIRFLNDKIESQEATIEYLSGEELMNTQYLIQQIKTCKTYVETADNIGHEDLILSDHSISFNGWECPHLQEQPSDYLESYCNWLPYSLFEDYLTDYGKSVFGFSQQKTSSSNNYGKLYSGTVDNQYPISLILYPYTDDETIIRAAYVYDKYGAIIPIRGQFNNNQLSLNSFNNSETFDLTFTPDGLVGFWTNERTQKQFPIMLKYECD